MSLCAKPQLNTTTTTSLHNFKPHSYIITTPKPPNFRMSSTQFAVLTTTPTTTMEQTQTSTATEPKPAPKPTPKTKAFKAKAKAKAKDEAKARKWVDHLHQLSQTIDPVSEAWFKSDPAQEDWQSSAWDNFFKQNPGIERHTQAWLREGPCLWEYLAPKKSRKGRKARRGAPKPKFGFPEAEFPLPLGATAVSTETATWVTEDKEEALDWAEEMMEWPLRWVRVAPQRRMPRSVSDSSNHLRVWYPWGSLSEQWNGSWWTILPPGLVLINPPPLIIKLLIFD